MAEDKEETRAPEPDESATAVRRAVPEVDVRKRPGGGGPVKPWVTALALATVAVFAGIVWYAYQTRERGGEPPLVAAAEGPAKVRPEEPGGLEVPDQDKLVYEEAAGEAVAEAEELLPPPEEPAVMAEDAADTAPLDAVAASLDDSFQIQLGAFSSAAKADGVWQGLLDNHGDLLAGLVSDVVSVDVAGKGTFYRLRAGPLADKADAADLCRALKDRGQDCLVVEP